mmetsp:Transcript_46412/g.107113  ORF Transcript_46412/g.107113 Transcript_46412/m.107113 type:complete len:215 (+) Transcript_46412:687-1331(+)
MFYSRMFYSSAFRVFIGQGRYRSWVAQRECAQKDPSVVRNLYSDACGRAACRRRGCRRRAGSWAHPACQPAAPTHPTRDQAPIRQPGSSRPSPPAEDPSPRKEATRRPRWRQRSTDAAAGARDRRRAKRAGRRPTLRPRTAQSPHTAIDRWSVRVPWQSAGGAVSRACIRSSPQTATRCRQCRKPRRGPSAGAVRAERARHATPMLPRRGQRTC